MVLSADIKIVAGLWFVCVFLCSCVQEKEKDSDVNETPAIKIYVLAIENSNVECNCYIFSDGTLIFTTTITIKNVPDYCRFQKFDFFLKLSFCPLSIWKFSRIFFTKWILPPCNLKSNNENWKIKSSFIKFYRELLF